MATKKRGEDFAPPRKDLNLLNFLEVDNWFKNQQM